MKRRNLDRLPYQPKGLSLEIPSGDVVEFYSYQIVVWSAITRATETWTPDEPRLFPCVVDTGTNRGFFLKESHLTPSSGPRTPSWDCRRSNDEDGTCTLTPARVRCRYEN